MNPITDIDELEVVLRRPDAGAPLRGLTLPRGSLRGSLLLKPDSITSALGVLARLAGKLPEVPLTASQKAQRRRQAGPRLATVLRNYAYCLRSAPGLLGEGTKISWPSADRMDMLASLMDRYAGIHRYASQGVARAMDLRLLVGAYEGMLLKQVTEAVVRRIEDKNTSAADRSRLQNAFASVLLRKDQLLGNAEARRAQKGAADQAATAALAEEQKRQLLFDTAHALMMNLPVDQATLEQAALYYAEQVQKQKEAAVAGGNVGPAMAGVGAGASPAKAESEARKAPR